MVTRRDPVTGGAIIPAAIRQYIEEAIWDMSASSLGSLFSAVPKTPSTAKVHRWHPPYGTPMRTSSNHHAMALGDGSVYCFDCGEVNDPFTGAWVPDTE